jgi:multidrug efflux pump subunit AcrA (membrane-fusion protein)
VAKVAAADLIDTFEAGGIVQAQTTATIMARIQAPVLEVRAVPGDRVRAGQVLIVLDGRDLSALADSARAAATAADQTAAAAVSERQAADAALALARATSERISALLAKRSATAQEYDESIAALRAAEARAAGGSARVQAALSSVESARSASEAAATTASFSRITAPFDGIVTVKTVEPGNLAAPGTPLMRLEDTRAFRFEVRLDESRTGQISPGVVVPVSIEPGGASPWSLDGRVLEVARAVDADARAFLVKIALPEAAGLRSGTFGRAQFSGGTRRALQVPAGALVRRGQLTTVFVVDEGVARLRLVSVRGTEVLAGLSESDVVIVDAPATLTDGQRVSEGTRS